MGRFNIKNYKLNTTPISRLKRLSTPHLEEVLNSWARIGNQRAKRMGAIDPLYSALLEYDKGGKFGKHSTHASRETMLNELIRIKKLGKKLNKVRLMEEKSALEKAYENLDKKAPVEDKISLTTFRWAFSRFKSKYDMVNKDFYEKAKQAILKTSLGKYTLADVTLLIERLYFEYKYNLVEAQELNPDNSLEPYSPDDIDELPLT